MSPAVRRPRTLFRLIPGFMLVESLLKIEADRALARHAELAYYQIALVRCDYPDRSILPFRNHAPRRIGVSKRQRSIPLPDG
jgi:hypothetical protein